MRQQRTFSEHRKHDIQRRCLTRSNGPVSGGGQTTALDPTADTETIRLGLHAGVVIRPRRAA